MACRTKSTTNSWMLLSVTTPGPTAEQPIAAVMIPRLSSRLHRSFRRILVLITIPQIDPVLIYGGDSSGTGPASWRSILAVLTSKSRTAAA